MNNLEFFRLQTREEVLALYPRFAPVGTEEVDLAAAVGRVLAGRVAAPEAVPGFLRATMDGYAVAARDTFGASVGAPQYLEIKGDVAMGAAPDAGHRPRRGPAGAHRRHVAAGGRRGGHGGVHRGAPGPAPWRCAGPWPRGKTCLQPGEDVRPGRGALPGRARRLRPQEIGLLAALGITRLEVYQQPRVAILSSGDEIVPIDRQARPRPGAGCQRLSGRGPGGRRGAASRCSRASFPTISRRLRAALAAALTEADLILISGGSSVGARDLTLAAIQDLPGRRGPGARGGHPARQTHHPGVPGETRDPSPSWACRGIRPPPRWSWRCWGGPCWRICPA